MPKEEQQFLFIMTRGEVGADIPNVDCEVFRGTQKDMEELYLAGKTEITEEYGDSPAPTLYLARIQKFAEPTYTTTIFEDPDINDPALLGI
jgi:hypothetical protein